MTLEQIKKKMRYGDYATLSRMLDINPEAAKMRFLRKDTKAIEGMIVIIECRERMIAEFLKANA